MAEARAMPPADMDAAAIADAGVQPENDTLPRAPNHPPPPPMVDLRGLETAQSTDANLSCPICHSLLVLPVTLPCEHVYCRECLDDALQHQPVRSRACPSCRTPTVDTLIRPAPKIISRILDDVRVKCPFTAMGCSTITGRGDIQSHVDHYCGFVAVECPGAECKMMVERQFASRACLHGSFTCDACGKARLEMDRAHHRRSSCVDKHELCTICSESVPISSLAAHTKACMDTSVPCSASSFGCDRTAPRREIVSHEQLCPLVKLMPFLKRQATQLEWCEDAIKHLKIKTEIYEEGLTNVQETLRDTLEDAATGLAPASGMAAPTPPFESQTAHLLDLHDALQGEVRRISAAVSDLDAKLEVSVLNQTLRANEEKLHRDAVEGQMRKQLQWLVSSRLQASQQRAGAMRSNAPIAAGIAPNQTAGFGATGILTAESERWGASSTPIRRLSDSSRSETKL